MALPKINTFPWYDITIPSTNQTVRYRPYNVGEQKTLLVTFEAGEASNIAKALLDIVINCVEEDLDKNALTTFDVEYLFLQIRSKSVGETTSIGLRCSECEHQNSVEVTIDQIKIDRDKFPDKMVPINDDYTLELKFPTYIDVLENKEGLSKETISELLYEMVVQSLDKLHTPDELIRFKDEPLQEVLKFVDNLTTEQYEKLLGFVNNLPRLRQDVKYECEECNHKNNYTLEGLYDFF